MIRILHLFPKLMNLYGDYGNIAVLQRALVSMGTEVSVFSTENPSEIKLSDYDFVFAGAGTEKKTELAASLLAPLSAEFKAAASGGVSMLFTGSASELVCREIECGSKTVPALGIFDAVVRRTSDRQTGDVLYRSEISECLAAGFINKSGFVRTEEKPLFKPYFGPGSFEDIHELDISGEGLAKCRVRATYVTGPILVRNPWLKRFIAEELFSMTMPSCTPKAYDDEYAQKGWEVTVSELEKRRSAGQRA